MSTREKQHIVIIGGGFGGLYAAKAMRHAPSKVTLVDKRNFHLFQPLLYQVATGGLSPGDISSPLRSVLKYQKNTEVLTAEVIDIDPDDKRVILRDGEIGYDSLIVATGAGHHYFGHDAEWADNAPGLKTVEDALDMRRRILVAFEAAERETDPKKRRAWLTFVIVGGGPTGVELAGALGELATHTMRHEFRHIDPAEARIIIVEGLDRLLSGFPAKLSSQAEASLEHLGVSIWKKQLVTEIEDDYVKIRDLATEEETLVPARTVLWAAGVKASSMGDIVAKRTGAEQDRSGRIIVQPDLTLPDYPDIFVIGDLAHYAHQTGEPLPGVAQVAMQQGQYVANLLRKQRLEKDIRPFQYRDKGNLAVIGRNAAVADVGELHFSGFLAWLIWAFVHIQFLIEYDNKFMVLSQWAWNYFTRKRGARLITGQDPFPLINLTEFQIDKEEEAQLEPIEAG